MDNDPRYSWQGGFHQKYRSVNSPVDFTLVACPGAGKTRAVLKLAREMLDIREIRFMEVVCPTKVVRDQWYNAAHGEGISLHPTWENGDAVIASDYNGVIVTYQTVNSQPGLHRNITRRYGPTLVVFDEIHHATDPCDWAESIRFAFEGTARRIALSGTPYNPSRRIAFLNYDPDGYVIPDFGYYYRSAVRDRVCRSIHFPRKGGMSEWDFNDKRYRHDSGDTLPQKEAAQRRKTMIYADFDRISEQAEQIILDADHKLSQVRNEIDPRAGGLVVAMGREPGGSTRHAEAVASHMFRLLGRRPPVVTSDDPRSLARIEAFRNSTERWLVAVRMISEGADIPRLRVGAYLTNVATQLHFDQLVGRFVRGDGEAHLFIPDDPELVRYAGLLAEERKQAMREMTPMPREPSDDLGDRTGGYSFAGSHASDAGVVTPGTEDVLFEMHRIDRAEYLAARDALRDQWPGDPPHDVIGKYVLAQRRRTCQPVTPDPTAAPLAEQKKALSDTMNRLVRSYCYQHEEDFAAVNGRLNEAAGIRRMRDATLPQLQERLRHCEKLNGHG
jgi:superfamily II DNA or RNA helicase